MEKIFITQVVYKDIKFKIYMINGDTVVESDDKRATPELIEEVKKIFFDENKILTDNKKKKIIIPAIIISTGLLIGTFSKKDILKLDNNENNLDNEYDLEYELNDSNVEIQKTMASEEDYYSECLAALFSNENLTTEDCLSFMERFPYIEANKDNIDFNELLNSLRTVKVIKYDTDYSKNPNVVGTFTIDKETGTPIISLYRNATEDSFIHEQYHVIKYNKYYWDAVYFWDGKFIGTEDYEKLDKESQKKIMMTGSKYDKLYGNMIEEAHTSILTAKDSKSTEKLNITYSKETYIFEMYEKIFGEENIEKYMFQSNQLVGFMNELLDLGCTRQEVIAIVDRLDKYNNSNGKDIDTSILKYQVCDDLAYVYNKKFNTIDDDLLKTTILSITNNIDKESVADLKNEYKMKELYDAFMDDSLSITNYIPEDVRVNYALDYGINDILIDYFSSNTTQVYIETMNVDYVVLKLNDENLTYQKTFGSSETAQYAYKLYTDYYQYAVERFGNNQDYATYFASIYANMLLTAEEKGELIEYYDLWKEKFLSDSEARKVIFSQDYDAILEMFNSVKEMDENSGYSR